MINDDVLLLNNLEQQANASLTLAKTRRWLDCYQSLDNLSKLSIQLFQKQPLLAIKRYSVFHTDKPNIQECLIQSALLSCSFCKIVNVDLSTSIQLIKSCVWLLLVKLSVKSKSGIIEVSNKLLTEVPVLEQEILQRLDGSLPNKEQTTQLTLLSMVNVSYLAFVKRIPQTFFKLFVMQLQRQHQVIKHGRLKHLTYNLLEKPLERLDYFCYFQNQGSISVYLGENQQLLWQQPDWKIKTVKNLNLNRPNVAQVSKIAPIPLDLLDKNNQRHLHLYKTVTANLQLAQVTANANWAKLITFIENADNDAIVNWFAKNPQYKQSVIKAYLQTANQAKQADIKQAIVYFGKGQLPNIIALAIIESRVFTTGGFAAGFIKYQSELFANLCYQMAIGAKQSMYSHDMKVAGFLFISILCMFKQSKLQIRKDKLNFSSANAKSLFAVPADSSLKSLITQVFKSWRIDNKVLLSFIELVDNKTNQHPLSVLLFDAQQLYLAINRGDIKAQHQHISFKVGETTPLVCWLD